MNSFVGILFLGIPLIIGVSFAIKQTIDNKRKRGLRRILIAIIVGCLLLTWLGIDKINRDDDKEDKFAEQREADAARRRTDSLNLDAATRKITLMSNHFSEFKKALETKHDIIEDPKTGQPVLKNVNITTRDVETLTVNQ